MALFSSPESDTSGALGDASSGRNAKAHALSCARFLLLNHRQSRDTQFLYGGFAYTILVWIYKLGQRVGPPRTSLITSLMSVKHGSHPGSWSLFQWLFERHALPSTPAVTTTS